MAGPALPDEALAHLAIRKKFGAAEDARAEELRNLKLALATFAIQLDAFEAHLATLAPNLLAKALKITASDPVFASKIVAAMKSADRNAP